MSNTNFLKEFLSIAEGTEIPETFALWSGVAGVSCVMGRRSWIDMGTFTIFPNFYIVLVAGSGRCRKSTSVKQIKKILHQMEPKPKILAQKITPEALIYALKSKRTENDQEYLSENNEGYIVADELAMFLNRKSYESGLGPLLIQMYDCEDPVEHQTLSRGVESVSKSCLGLLGASTFEWIRNALPPDAVGGGLASRIIFIYVEQPPPPVAITTFDERKMQAQRNCIKELERIYGIEGEFKLTTDTWEEYKNEYERFYKESQLFNMNTLSGYASRRHVHILKLSMILSVCEGDDRLIKPEHFKGAKWMIEECEKSLPRVLQIITASERGTETEQILKVIKSKGKISRSELLRSVSHKVDARELQEILDTLIHSNQIESFVGSQGSLYYRPL